LSDGLGNMQTVEMAIRTVEPESERHFAEWYGYEIFLLHAAEHSFGTCWDMSSFC
jgi:hypothetical protein